MTLHRRPMCAKDYYLAPDKSTVAIKMAIVLQGPIIRENYFTLETVRLYKKIFPNHYIIVSTWDDENTDYLDQFIKEGAEVILNKKPAYSGPYNINFQITSTCTGIKRAEDIGVDYVIKSRTDQRIYNPNSQGFLINLIKAFPITHNYHLQKQRIVSLCFATFKYKLYHASDTFMFGSIEDMSLYWDVKLVAREPKELFRPEYYLFSEFLKRIGRKIKGTIQDSWETYADHIVVVDHASLDWYWHKPKRHREYPVLEYHRNDNRLIYFSEWLNLYLGSK